MFKSKKVDVVRAWKDEEYRESLSVQEQALVPANPVGLVELSDADLEFVLGGAVAAQTGTGSANCYCIKTKTASSSGGSCYCVCEEQADVDPGGVLV